MIITLYEIHDNRIITKTHDIDGEETYYAFTKEEAETLEYKAITHDKSEPKSKYYHQEVELVENELEIPDDYEITTAEQLYTDLATGEVESSDFDACCGSISKIINRRTTVID